VRSLSRRPRAGCERYSAAGCCYRSNWDTLGWWGKLFMHRLFRGQLCWEGRKQDADGGRQTSKAAFKRHSVKERFVRRLSRHSGSLKHPKHTTCSAANYPEKRETRDADDARQQVKQHSNASQSSLCDAMGLRWLLCMLRTTTPGSSYVDWF